MYIYSGKCRFCTVGLPTGIYDARGELLFTGDIVLIYSANELEVSYLPDSLTVVIDKQYTSYSDGTHIPVDGPTKPFVMGIASVDLASDPEWFCIKVKDHKDVVHGEHWRAYGFNFREEEV